MSKGARPLWGLTGQTGAVACCGVAEVLLVVISKPFVEPLRYPGRLQAGLKDSVLHVAGHDAQAVPFLLRHRPRTAVV